MLNGIALLYTEATETKELPSPEEDALFREIKIGCFGVDGAGKTTILKMIKGENPRGVLSTNGFSMIDMEYSDEFTIKVYDLGGHERIRDIWTNYYAEVHGIMYVVDISDEERLEENYETIRKVQLHRGTARKPFLVVLNKKKHTELDDFDFSRNADLNESGTAQGQMIFITHVNQYKGELDNAKYPPPMVTKRPQRQVNLLLAQFCTFIDKIIEHYVFLSEGVHTAEMELKVRQQTERDERRLRLMRQEQDRVNSEIAALDQRSITGNVSGNGDIRRDTLTTLAEEPQLSNVEEEEEENHPESRPKTASTSPSVSDTQSPAVDSPHFSVSQMSSEVFGPPPAIGPPPAPLPHPPPPKPARSNQVAPAPSNGILQPLPPLRNADIFTVEGSKELYTVFPEAPAIEKHLRRMRRIQAGLRRRAEEMKMKNDELQLESL